MFDEKPTLPTEGASIETNADQPTDPISNETASEAQPASDAKSEKSYELSDIAQLLDVDENEIDVDETGKVVFKTKIDGKEGKAKVKDFKTTYQKQGHVDNQGREVAQLREKAEAQIKEQYETFNQRLSHLENVNSIAVQQLLGDYQKIDWKELEQTDSGLYAAKQLEFMQRKAQLDQAAAFLSNQRNDLQRKELAKEAELLPSRISEWSNPEVMSAEKKALSQYMEENKLSPRLTMFADGLAVTRKAMLYDKLQSEKAEVKKLVRVAPKVSQPGASGKQTAQKSAIDILFGD